MNAKQKVMVSGVKPTGRPHIGNYFGAMRQFVDLQEEYKSYVFIANYHALTSTQNREEMRANSIDIALDYLAMGLDPEKTTIFLQSDVPEVTELAWVLNCLTTVPYLKRAHAFKDAETKNREIDVGTFDYPILMAADILIQDADIVPVGQDQKQHVEIARDTAGKFNRVFGQTFKLPEHLIMKDVETVPGIDGRKMSKSYGNTIPLFAEDEDIKKIVMSIVTDSKAANEPKDPSKCNIFALHKLFSQPAELSKIKKRYEAGDISYKESKELLAENIISFVKPMREKREMLSSDLESVLRILRNGGEMARENALLKMREVKEKTGLII